MIEFDRVTVTYADAPAPVLRDVSFTVDEGELLLVAGRTGSGKSTLLATINGLVPHFTGGTVAGTVRVAGRATADFAPREFADVVGVVGQDPLAGFVTDTVDDELAYAMEQLGLPRAVMRRRVEETLDLLGLAELRGVALHELSGGQQQRVAIGAVLTAHPKVLVLDEPTSALDPVAAEEVLAAITRLVHDLGVTVVLAEHRLERVVQYADRIAIVEVDGRVRVDQPAAALMRSPVSPPVVDLGRLAGWSPLPLSVREARRAAPALRGRLGPDRPPPVRQSTALEVRALVARGVGVRYGRLAAVHDVDLDLRVGEIVALMGRNGSGKSSLLWALQGSGRRHSGIVSVSGLDPSRLAPAARRHLVGLVPQTPSDLLYLDTVGRELTLADRDGSSRAGDTARELLDRLAPGVADDSHPRDLSEGQRLALVLAVALRARPAVVLLDEPTRGLDYPAKAQLAATLAALAADGLAIVIATHDVEFAAVAADRVAVLADGAVVADGPAETIIVASPAYAPQVAKILAPSTYLTVAQVATALAAGAR